jgi:hypothetical protein
VKLAIKFLLVGILLIGVLMVGWCWHRSTVLRQAFVQVGHGDSPSKVIGLFGQRPVVTMNVQTNMNWDEVWVDNTNGSKCTLQLHFYPPFSLYGESWVVGFDERSNAVTKYHIVSP